MKRIEWRSKRAAYLAMTLLYSSVAFSQNTDLLELIKDTTAKKQIVSSAFKSSRIINNHSIELMGKGTMDVRILHRFGLLNSGIENLFGLDQATMRFGFDYGIMRNLNLGIGRSTYKKEWDGFVKWRILQQSKGFKAFPLSVVWLSGITVSTIPTNGADPKRSFTERSAYFHELLIGRKFSEKFSLQLSPILVHRNFIQNSNEQNDVFALGMSSRLKLSKRIALVIDYDYVIEGLDKQLYTNPLAIGFDIETGGHVFQLHFSNSQGMNERAFITETLYKWSKGEINFGFNLSRVFTVDKRKRKQ